jgi:hypothetical protein
LGGRVTQRGRQPVLGVLDELVLGQDDHLEDRCQEPILPVGSLVARPPSGDPGVTDGCCLWNATLGHDMLL